MKEDGEDGGMQGCGDVGREGIWFLCSVRSASADAVVMVAFECHDTIFIRQLDMIRQKCSFELSTYM